MYSMSVTGEVNYKACSSQNSTRLTQALPKLTGKLLINISLLLQTTLHLKSLRAGKKHGQKYSLVRFHKNTAKHTEVLNQSSNEFHTKFCNKTQTLTNHNFFCGIFFTLLFPSNYSLCRA